MTFLREEERPRVPELKFSVVDVNCRDGRGTVFMVEMQVLNVAGFEKRVVYNASKAYVGQLNGGDDYPKLDDVIAVTICDFLLWPDATGTPVVPLVSHWRLQEQHGGRVGLSQVQYVFVELPKYPIDRVPSGSVEEWAYVFRMGSKLDGVPATLHDAATRRALEAARSAQFTAAEWETYARAKVAEQDARGALQFAEARGEARGETRGKAEGKAEGLRTAIETACEFMGVAINDARRAQVAAMTVEALEALLGSLRRDRAWPG